EPLAPCHDRTAFRCGDDSLDRYVREQAGQDGRRGTARIFVDVACDQPERVLGFFTLSAAAVVPSDLPPEMERRLPRHPIPAALVGRLAIDRSVSRRGLGSVLLADAVKKTKFAAATVAMSVIVVDPIDETARAFYAAFGFRSLLGPQRRMFLPIP
ncbi:MAG: GNAT family N-acetyltransferase, partial [Alphaproteobacteria bacterium]|nr:GNAT family N-acetyltransferase [Alphaproteobacteria bacterium]